MSISRHDILKRIRHNKRIQYDLINPRREIVSSDRTPERPVLPVKPEQNATPQIKHEHPVDFKGDPVEYETPHKGDMREEDFIDYYEKHHHKIYPKIAGFEGLTMHLADFIDKNKDRDPFVKHMQQQGYPVPEGKYPGTFDVVHFAERHSKNNHLSIARSMMGFLVKNGKVGEAKKHLDRMIERGKRPDIDARPQQ